MKTGVTVPKAVSFIGLILIVQSCWTITSSKGNECKTAKPLQLHSKHNNSCPSDWWNKIKCDPFLGGSRSRQRCSRWCKLFASCFGGKKKMQSIQQCSSKFRSLAPFEAHFNGSGGSGAVVNVAPCSPFRKGVFIIKAGTGVSCPPGIPCDIQRPQAPGLLSPFEKPMLDFFTSINEIKFGQQKRS
ncbi:hypothetical protein ACROYT_G032407 [Oculina patagonica]